MAHSHTNAGPLLRRKAPANFRGDRPDASGLSPADLSVPRVIEVEGNEEFLDRIAAIFAEQVLEARAKKREQQGRQAQE